MSPVKVTPTHKSVLIFCYRGSQAERWKRPGSLPSRDLAFADDRHRLHDEAPQAQLDRGLQRGQKRQNDHIPQLQLHGTALRAGAKFESNSSLERLTV